MNDIQFNRTGEYVAYAAQNTVSVWTMGDGNLVWRLSNRVESRPSCRFALRNEDEVLYVMDQEKVKVLEVGGEWKETAIKLRDYGADEIYVDVSRNGRWLATSTRYGLTIWDLDQRQVAQPGYPSGDFGDVAFHPKEDILACRGADGVDVVSVPDGRRLGRIRLPKPSHHVGLTFNPSGDLLVIEVLGIDVIQGSVEPDLDFYSWVELWDWQWGAQLYRFADAGSAFFNWAGTELVVAGHCLEFWAIPGPKVVTRAEQEWIPEYDSQGNPYRHPNYMDDD